MTPDHGLDTIMRIASRGWSLNSQTATDHLYGQWQSLSLSDRQQCPKYLIGIQPNLQRIATFSWDLTILLMGVYISFQIWETPDEMPLFVTQGLFLSMWICKIWWEGRDLKINGKDDFSMSLKKSSFTFSFFIQTWKEEIQTGFLSEEIIQTCSKCIPNFCLHWEG